MYRNYYSPYTYGPYNTSPYDHGPYDSPHAASFSSTRASSYRSAAYIGSGRGLSFVALPPMPATPEEEATIARLNAISSDPRDPFAKMKEEMRIGLALAQQESALKRMQAELRRAAEHERQRTAREQLERKLADERIQAERDKAAKDERTSKGLWLRAVSNHLLDSVALIRDLRHAQNRGVVLNPDTVEQLEQQLVQIELDPYWAREKKRGYPANYNLHYKVTLELIQAQGELRNLRWQINNNANHYVLPGKTQGTIMLGPGPSSSPLIQPSVTRLSKAHILSPNSSFVVPTAQLLHPAPLTSLSLTPTTPLIVSTCETPSSQSIEYLNVDMLIHPYSSLGLITPVATDKKLADKASNMQLREKTTHLWLTCAQITDEGLHYVAQFKALQGLNLSCCKHITGRGLVELTHLSNLTELTFDSSTIMDEGLEYISQIEGLKKLSLKSASKVTNQGVKHLSKLKNLQVLNLGVRSTDNTNITGAALPYLVEVQDLKHLCLSGRSISDADVACLAQCHELELLEIGWTSISLEALKSLKSQLPNCRIFYSDGEVTPESKEKRGLRLNSTRTLLGLPVKVSGKAKHITLP